MLIETLTWLYSLFVLTFIVIIVVVRRCSKVRVWIKMHPKSRQPLTEIGYLDMNGDHTAGEVHLSGSGSKIPIGRVIVDGQSKKNIGSVEVLTSDIEDETEKPRYVQCGYISFERDAVVDELGYIYRQQKGRRKKELIGYCARPSDPETPSIEGERSWKTLWLVKTLNAYYGEPAKVKKERLLQQNTAVFIGNDAGAPEEPSETFEFTDNKHDFPAFWEVDNTNDQDLPAESNTPAEHEPVIEPEPVSDPEPVSEPEPISEPETPVDPEVPVETEDTETAPAKTEDEGKKKKEKKKREKKLVKEPAAICYYTGFHSTIDGGLSSEARACAYALLGEDRQPRRYSEYYREHPYGWKDTALLTSFIYSILFLVLYTVNTGVLQMPLIGDDFRAVGILTACYFVLWALVRLIKIDRIENSNSFQSKLDLFNKNLNLGLFNIAIIILALLAGYATIHYYDYDLLPMIFAIAFGVAINMTLYGANKPWYVSSSYLEDEEHEDGDLSEVKNPDGDIARSYEWDLDPLYARQKLHGDLNLYFSERDIKAMRQCNPFFAQRKDKSDKTYITEMYSFLIEHKPMLARVRYIAAYINRIAQKQGLTTLEKIQFTLDFVQEPNIQFKNNRDCQAINYYENYIRFPDETLYDKEGDCNSKSLLASMLFHVMGYNVLYMSSRKFQHAAIGIEVSLVNLIEGEYFSMDKIEKLTILENGKRYIYCETTGDRFTIGATMEGMSLDDFEDKVLLPLDEDGMEDDAILLNDDKTCFYNWTLDSERGIRLEGKFSLDFSNTRIEDLRSVNPFQDYGHNGNTYEMNIRSMFQYLFEESSRMEKVNMLADYIRAVTEKAGCNEVDTLQFALDFVQAPNIEYRLDAESVSIDRMREYMRFPDEVLYDKEGDCDCKSSLMAALFHALGHNVLIMLSEQRGHAAIGLEFREEWRDLIQVKDVDSVLFVHNGRRYLYCETTGDGFRIGHMIEGDIKQNYDRIVEIMI